MPIPAEDDPVVTTLAGELDSLTEDDAERLRRVLHLIRSNVMAMEQRVQTLEEKLGPKPSHGKAAPTAPAGGD